jgi:hypothetical protein
MAIDVELRHLCTCTIAPIANHALLHEKSKRQHINQLGNHLLNSFLPNRGPVGRSFPGESHARQSHFPGERGLTFLHCDLSYKPPSAFSISAQNVQRKSRICSGSKASRTMVEGEFTSIPFADNQHDVFLEPPFRESCSPVHCCRCRIKARNDPNTVPI